MKRLFCLVGFVCLFAMLLPACGPAPEPEPKAAPEPVFDQAQEEEAIREAAKQELAAWNKHDVKALSAMSAGNFENWSGTRKGRAAWEEYHTEFFEGRGKNVHDTDEEIGIVFVTPEVAIYKSRGETTNLLDDDGKPLAPEKYLFAEVWVKKNGKWLSVATFERPIEE